jgi:antibiotic biosynthesis monooxygenase (ABM) superfamily enzyme
LVLVAVLVSGDDGGVVMPVDPELPEDPQGPVTTTVTRRIKPGHEAADEQFLAGISAAARAFPGYLGTEAFRPTPGAGGDDRIVYRFGTAAHLHSWLASAERAAWLARAEAHIAGPMATQVLVGLEGWFTLPTQPGVPPPPPAKMALVTWATIFPLITGVVVATAPLLGPLPLVARLAVTTGTAEQPTKASWPVDDLAELGTVDGVADLGFAPAAWFIDPGPQRDRPAPTQRPRHTAPRRRQANVSHVQGAETEAN